MTLNEVKEAVSKNVVLVNDNELKAYKILHNLSDRRGLGDEWDQCDEDVKEEIFQTFVSILNGGK